MNIRFLETGFKSAAENMAIDEAILEEVAAGRSGPTLRLYGWRPAAISIGYFQSLEEEVDVAACREHGVDVVRRMTGGGAVLHEDEITYSIHIPEKSEMVSKGILESYGEICSGVLEGCGILGLKAQFVPLNDLVVPIDGVLKKFSGNAQTRSRGVVVQHGTILLNVDVEKMFSLLKVPSEKLKGKLITDIKQRVTGLSTALSRTITFDEARGIFQEGFQKAFKNHKLIRDRLTATEETRARVLAREKYGNDTWNKRR